MCRCINTHYKDSKIDRDIKCVVSIIVWFDNTNSLTNRFQNIWQSDGESYSADILMQTYLALMLLKHCTVQLKRDTFVGVHKLPQNLVID